VKKEKKKQKKQEKKQDGVVSRSVTRRQFVVGAGAAVATGVLGGLTGTDALARKEESLDQGGKTQAIGHLTYDPVLCTGCQTCQLICSTARRGKTSPKMARLGHFHDDFGSDKDYEPKPCLHCPDPPCWKACEFDALHINPVTGVAFIDEEACTGCALCQEACPFDPPRIGGPDPDTEKFFKCDLCNGDPLCAKWCPNLSLHYKTSDEFTPKIAKGLPVEDSYLLELKEEWIKELGYPRGEK
jgi:Fe-S-cluster-containing dehydrogenase component